MKKLIGTLCLVAITTPGISLAQTSTVNGGSDGIILLQGAGGGAQSIWDTNPNATINDGSNGLVVFPGGGAQSVWDANPNATINDGNSGTNGAPGLVRGIDNEGNAFFTLVLSNLLSGLSGNFQPASTNVQIGQPSAGNVQSSSIASPYVTDIVTIIGGRPFTDGAAVRDDIVRLLASFPEKAKDYAAALIEISRNGAPPSIVANASLTSTMAEALATQVAAWQAQGSDSFVAVSALAAVNEALAAGGIGTGSTFAIAFSAKLSQLGGSLATLTSSDSPLTVLTYFTPKNETSLISPN